MATEQVVLSCGTLSGQEGADFCCCNCTSMFVDRAPGVKYTSDSALVIAFLEVTRNQAQFQRLTSATTAGPAA